MFAFELLTSNEMKPCLATSHYFMPVQRISLVNLWFVAELLILILFWRNKVNLFLSPFVKLKYHKISVTFVFNLFYFDYERFWQLWTWIFYVLIPASLSCTAAWSSGPIDSSCLNDIDFYYHWAGIVFCLLCSFWKENPPSSFQLFPQRVMINALCYHTGSENDWQLRL